VFSWICCANLAQTRPDVLYDGLVTDMHQTAKVTTMLVVRGKQQEHVSRRRWLAPAPMRALDAGQIDRVNQQNELIAYQTRRTVQTRRSYPSNLWMIKQQASNLHTMVNIGHGASG
jgi:hypothetical protein